MANLKTSALLRIAGKGAALQEEAKCLMNGINALNNSPPNLVGVPV